ncbi:MAG: hypothetical protein JF609_06795 [Verrucomicrobia bacterium]|nr:hypothetical protein [Verrucomicrobiota bacterium]
MSMVDVKGSGLPPNAGAQMKAMGMDVVVTITRPEKKLSYLIYPGMQSYVENPAYKGDDAVSPDDLKMESTEIKYTNIQSMIQEVMMKKMSGATGRPPGQ